MKIDKNKIANILESKNATQPCTRCGNTSFSIADGFGTLNIQNEYSNNITLGGPHIPVVYVICNNCGSVTPHALGAIGLMPTPSTVPTPKDEKTPEPTPNQSRKL